MGNVMDTMNNPVRRKAFRGACCLVYALLCLLYAGGWWMVVDSIGKPPWCELQPWLGDKPEITDCDWFNGNLSVIVKATPQQAADYAAALQLEQRETAQDGTVRYDSPGPCRLRTLEGSVFHDGVDIKVESRGDFCTVAIRNHFWTPEEAERPEPRTIPARFPYREPWLEDLPPSWAAFFNSNAGLTAFVSGVIMLSWAVLFFGPFLLVDGALLLCWRRPPHGFWRWAAWLLLPVALLVPSLLGHLATLPEWDFVAIFVTFLFGFVLGCVSLLASMLQAYVSRLLLAVDKRLAGNENA